jgi:pimeloyl-ACP methyl ester carboxylesterase/DNA-binding CsgD family transcriptional regulator
MRHETRYARSGDTHIAYQVIGDGPRDLVFVMGWISHLDYFWEGPSADFLNRLASFSRLILFDKRGTGLSDRVAELPSIEQRMDDVRAVMDAAGSERAALLGISEGAAMCALFAATYPERTAALVLYGAYAKRLRDPDYPWAPTPKQRQEFFDAIEKGWGGVVDLDTLAPSAAGDERFRQWWATYLQRSASPGAALALARMNTAIDIRHVLPAIRVPTLILHRTGDLDIDVGGARYMAERIPGATYVELPGNDHLVFAGDQEAVLGEIEQFLTGVRPATEPDSVLATILLTEMVGAVAVAARLGARAWAETLDTHERMVREEVARFRGREVSTTAAGGVAIFDGPARAVRCATAIVEQARGAGLDVRAGLHTGECEVMDGEVRGIAAQIAAQVLMRAERGTVVVSSTIPDLLAGSGITFHMLDQSVTTGTGRSLRLYQVLTTRTPGEAIGRSSRPTERGRLTPREMEVARLIALGQSNREVADTLFISVATVERHVANIFTRLDLRSRTQLGVWIAEHGLIAPDQG